MSKLFNKYFNKYFLLIVSLLVAGIIWGLEFCFENDALISSLRSLKYYFLLCAMLALGFIFIVEPLEYLKDIKYLKNIRNKKKTIGYVLVFLSVIFLNSFVFQYVNDPNINKCFKDFVCFLNDWKIANGMSIFFGGFAFARISSIDAKYIFEDWKGEEEKEEAKKVATTTTPSKSRKYTIEITRH